jgi:transcriptional regulator with XRE-family HTH domain
MNKRLKAARHKKGWSQEDAADAARVATRTYQRWEYGTHYPNFESRRFLREAFGATDEELGLDLVAYVEAFQGDEQQIATPTLQELASL